MKKLSLILSLILMLGSFVSCMKAEAEENNEGNVPEIVIDIGNIDADDEAEIVKAPESKVADIIVALVKELGVKAPGSASLDHDDVNAIFEAASEIYYTSEKVVLTTGEVINTIEAKYLDLEYAKTVTKDNSEAELDAHLTYLYDVFDIGIDILVNLVGEDAVIRPEHDGSLNIPQPDMMVALDLEGCESETLEEVIQKLHNGHPEYQNNCLLINGIRVTGYDTSINKTVALYPPREQRKITYALQNPGCYNVVAE